MAAKHWIKGAIKHPGALTKQASAAGKSPMAFAREHQHSSGVTGKRARLAITLSHMHKASHSGVPYLHPHTAAAEHARQGVALAMDSKHSTGRGYSHDNDAHQRMTALHQKAGDGKMSEHSETEGY